MLCSCALKIQSEPNGKREVFGWGEMSLNAFNVLLGIPIHLMQPRSSPGLLWNSAQRQRDEHILRRNDLTSKLIAVLVYENISIIN